MDTISLAAAAVIGSRHARAARNGQDAVATWRGVARSAAVVVVADGCGSGASSEVGARLGSALFARALGARLARGESVLEEATWDGARGDLVTSLAELLERTPGDRAELLHDCLLFTLVAAAASDEGAAVWALGDGAYAMCSRASDSAVTRVLGPFADNQPPYVAYDLLGEPRGSSFEVVPAACDAVVIATDGACDLFERGVRLEHFAARPFTSLPDKLRRELTLLARGDERIDWDARRVVRTPAVLQDDCAIGVMSWTREMAS